MAFSLHDFVFDTCKDMIGHEPDYKIKEYSLGWFTKSVLLQDDLFEIDTLILEKNVPTEIIIDSSTTLEEPIINESSEQDESTITNPIVDPTVIEEPIE